MMAEFVWVLKMHDLEENDSVVLAVLNDDSEQALHAQRNEVFKAHGWIMEEELPSAYIAQLVVGDDWAEWEPNYQDDNTTYRIDRFEVQG